MMRDTHSDDSGRRAYSPRPVRKPRPRRARSRLRIDLWQLRHGFGVGLTRAGCAVGFGFVPGFTSTFGDSALAVVSTLLAAGVIGIVLMLYRMSRPIEWTLLADAATLFVMVPVLATASGIEVADARFGGRSLNFFAAATAVFLLYVIITAIATKGGSKRNSAGQIGSLPAAMSITVILLGTAHFSAAAMWRGLSIAWMAAAVVSVVAVLTPTRYRLFVAPVAFALFAAAVVLPDVLSGNGTSLSTGSSAIAVITTAAVALILVLIPATKPSEPAGPPPD